MVIDERIPIAQGITQIQESDISHSVEVPMDIDEYTPQDISHIKQAEVGPLPEVPMVIDETPVAQDITQIQEPDASSSPGILIKSDQQVSVKQDIEPKRGHLQHQPYSQRCL